MDPRAAVLSKYISVRVQLPYLGTYFGKYHTTTINWTEKECKIPNIMYDFGNHSQA